MALEDAAAADRAGVLEEAVQARLSGDYDHARALLEALTSAEPDNADAWLQLGLARSATGDSRGARDAFLRVLALAPEYDDARLGLARLAYRSGDVAEAERMLNSMSPARSGDAEVVELRAALAGRRSEDSLWRVDAVASYSFLTNNFSE